MGQVIRVWHDLLCSECYQVLQTGMDSEMLRQIYRDGDEPMFCIQCEEFRFPIVVTKQEYDVRKVNSFGVQQIERDIEHGIEILHLSGVGIITNLEPEPVITQSSSSIYKFYRYNLRVKEGK